jgi:YggT family protein
MDKLYLVNFLNLLINAFMLLIFIRVLLSWIPANLGRFRQILNDLTEPILGPARKLIPPIGGLDLSPLVVFIILQIIQSYLANIL